MDVWRVPKQIRDPALSGPLSVARMADINYTKELQPAVSCIGSHCV
jgi:hypothetical protein